MSDHPTVGDEPETSNRDFVNPDSTSFFAPGTNSEPVPTNESVEDKAASSHHLAPSTPADEETENTSSESPSPPQESQSPEPNWIQVIDELPFAVVVFDDAKEVLHENRLCREIADFGIEEKGGIEEWLSALCPDERHREVVLETWHSDLWTNQGTRIFSLRVKKQKLRELEFRSSLNKDFGITVVIEDVTDRVRDEENRIHTKKKYRSLFAHTENGTVLVDHTGRIIDVNPAFLQLSERQLRELRMSSFASLLHPSDAAKMASSDAGIEDSNRQTVTLVCPSGEKKIGMQAMPIGANDGSPSMVAYLFDAATHLDITALQERLGIVSGKATALLNAVPDLIFLLDGDFTIADFIPPPEQWEELEVSDEWRGQRIDQIWPLLGELLESSRQSIVQENKTVRADLSGTTRNGSEVKPYVFSITASSGGDGQWLVVVRRKDPAAHAVDDAAPVDALCEQSSGTPTPEIEAHELPANNPLIEEINQHGFRNQIQLVTSLFSLEPQGAAARDAFLRWQIRLRAMTQAFTTSREGTVPLVEMIRSLANEICSLTGTGPARRAVVVSGSPHLRAESSDASLLALTVGELMRLVLAPRQQGRGPDIVFELDCDKKGRLFMKTRAGENRRFISSDEEGELETLEILASQMRGRIRGTSDVTPAVWKLVVPILKQ